MSEVRDAVEAAWKEQEVDETAVSDTRVVDPVEGQETKVADPVEGQETKVADPVEGQETKVADQQVADEILKAPGFWKPEAKAHWDKLPKEVQREALRRERESDRAMSHSAQARQFQEQFNKAIQPHMASIQAEGVEPMVAVNNLLAFATAMRTGSVTQRAHLIKEMIEAYDVDISTLDQLLTGQVAPETRVRTDVEKLLDERLKPVNTLLQRVEEAQRQREAAMEQSAADEIEQFAEANPLFNEVADDVADVIEWASQKGKKITLQAAYERALAMNPEVAAKIQRRAQPNREAAGSSVRGIPTRTPAAPIGDSVRAAVEAAWEKAQNS